MRRTLVALSAAALAASALAFAPAASPSQADTDHEVVFSGDGAQTVTGGVPGGINVTGFTESAVRCSSDPDAYCETILLTVEQPVADEDPDEIDFGSGDVTIDLTAAVQGGDFDFTVFESNANGSKGAEVATSGNFLACATFCEVPLVQPNQCENADECVAFGVSTSEFTSARHFLVEVVYFAAASEYTADFTYTRTDGRNADGTTGGGDGGADETAPAASAARVDVTLFDGLATEAGGDWGGGGDAAPLGSALGQDFEAAYLEYTDDQFVFTLDMTELPAIGGTPEATRYGWSFVYVSGDDRLELELDGKFTNYSRGTCDPTAGTCPPPRDPGLQPFLVRGNCYQDSSLPMTLTLCEELARVQATFDPADGTITVPIPASALAPDGVRACDRIEGIPSFIGASIWAAPSAFITNTLMPYDDANHYTPLVVPPADPALSC